MTQFVPHYTRPRTAQDSPMARESRCLECNRFHRNGASCVPVAQDNRPNWEPRKASEAQFKLISDMMKERGITAQALVEVFPTRPTLWQEASAVINWLKEQPSANTSSPAPTAQALPERKDKGGKPMHSYYAVEHGGTVKFFRIKSGRKPGFYFIDVQASDEFHSIRNYATKKEIIQAILDFGPKEAQEAYGQLIGKCGRCGRTLTDETSRAYGIGPDCREM